MQCSIVLIVAVDMDFVVMVWLFAGRKKQKILKNVAKMLFSVLYMGQKASIIKR